ncbi:alpha/beta hydrolase [Chondromyces apiculatus]|uniref:Serine aminopeptidase S33 domain-containing protein n=1 Tax=Chondromyces apiculatus DSM 436 TaxID=1192034 RepID=A0A017T7L2_9BACT|nr:alpha/beta hydrolase [Chondromyces apiculatus]EYF04800.1 Hypothetical protein CAP_3826 [Chondromyces apiculatus DSM 436]
MDDKTKKLLKRVLFGELSWRRLAQSVAFIYGTLLLFAVFGAERMLFLPHEAGYAAGPEVVMLDAGGGVKIASRYAVAPGARYAVLYSHGNAEDLGDVGPLVEYLQGLGVSVLAYDYAGYGLSEGSPSEAQAYADIEAAYAHLTGALGVPPERVIAYGRSLGGGPSVELARRKRLGGLVLESTFTSVYRVATGVPLFPRDRMVSIDKIGQVGCPVLVIHGRRDRVVPFKHGEALFASAPEPKRALWVDEAGHNDVMFVDERRYDEAVRGFVALVAEEEKRRGGGDGSGRGAL